MDNKPSCTILALAKPREAGLVEALAKVWEPSVKATHHFLKQADFFEIRGQIPALLREVDILHAAFVDGEPRGFLGACENSLEMLFVDAGHLGKGIGKALVLRALDDLHAVHEKVLVSVNEQNEGAHAFYLRMGFRDTARSDTDGEGRAYPLVFMEHTCP